MLDAVQHIKARLCRPGVVANPRDGTGHRCGCALPCRPRCDAARRQHDTARDGASTFNRFFACATDVFLRESCICSRSDQQLKTMSDDAMRNTMTVEWGGQTGLHAQLQQLDKLEFLRLAFGIFPCCCEASSVPLWQAPLAAPGNAGDGPCTASRQLPVRFAQLEP